MKQSNAQGEMQLLAEWLASLGAAVRYKTHVNVGARQLFYLGSMLTPAQQRAFGVWNSWADARVVTPSEVWIVEAKIVATGAAYGQVLDYVNQYPSSGDYQQFAPRTIVPVVVAQASRNQTAALFQAQGVRTILFEPSFPLSLALAKLFPAAQILAGGESD
jgi:hypothetical protein